VTLLRTTERPGDETAGERAAATVGGDAPVQPATDATAHAATDAACASSRRKLELWTTGACYRRLTAILLTERQCRSLEGVPQPPAPPRRDLDEVERAISVLEGRHPEHERSRRETMQAAEERRRFLERELAVRARKRVGRRVVGAAGVLALAAAVGVGWRLFERARSLRAGIARAETPFTAHGLVEIASNELTARERLDVNAPGESCFVAVATGGALVHAREGSTSDEAAGSVGWCACAPGRVTVEVPSSDGGTGIALLRIDAAVLGGPLARPWVDVAPARWAEGGAECADAMLAGWIEARRWPRPAIDDAWLRATSARGELGRAGFHVVSAVEAGRPFGVVEASGGDCMLAVPAANEILTVRAPNGAARIERSRGPVAWCASIASTSAVWRQGRGAVVVLAAPAARVGGLLGTRECAQQAGLAVDPAATWLSDDDLSWDAAALLHASGLRDATAAALPTDPGVPDARVVALALSPPAKVASDPTGAVVACDPPLEPIGATALVREAVCAHASPVAWWRRTEAQASGARASLPVWMSLFESHHEPEAVARIPELLTLARRLARERFEPTVFEGVTELDTGVRVVGRAGEDAIVAVGLAPAPPWVYPYTDGVPWELGDDPRVIALRPGEAIVLTSKPMPSAPRAGRRTVVFRHTLVP